jgi:S-DNA-T family DNA segregation ATPase FtsK/SpoIIIE
LQGVFVTDNEVGDVVAFLQKQTPDSVYDYRVEEEIREKAASVGMKKKPELDSGERDERDDLFEEVGWFIVDTEKAVIGTLQRKFKIGFNRAARIIDQLHEAGVVGPDEGTKARKVLMTPEQYARYIGE